MKNLSNDSEKEIEIRVYSGGEYTDLYAFNRALGELVWKALAEIVQKNTFPLNDYIESSKLRQFHKTMQHLLKQGVIRMLFPKVNEILHIGLGKDRKAKSTVLSVIVKHSRKRYLKMCHGYPSPERREFFQCLHRIFGIPPSEQRSFDRSLCRIIRQVMEDDNQ